MRIRSRWHLNVDDDEIARRRANWQACPSRATRRGVLAKFAMNAASASRGAVLDLYEE
jgi:dihydroxy-acid dehydratase